MSGYEIKFSFHAEGYVMFMKKMFFNTLMSKLGQERISVLIPTALNTWLEYSLEDCVIFQHSI